MASAFIWIHEHKGVAVHTPVVEAIVSNQHPGVEVCQVAPVIKVRAVRLIICTLPRKSDWKGKWRIYMPPRGHVDDVVGMLDVSAI